MTVIPTGLPSWARASSIETFGGHTEKENKAGVSAFNPKTMTSAEQMCRGVQVIRAVEATADFATVVFSCTSGSTTITDYKGQHGSGSLNAPTVGHLGDGYFTLTWDSSYEDEYGIEASVVLTGVQVTPESETPVVAFYKRLTNTSVRVEITNLSGVGVANVGGTVTVY